MITLEVLSDIVATAYSIKTFLANEEAILVLVGCFGIRSRVSLLSCSNINMYN